MATTQKGIYYPDDYTAVADVPEDMKKQAESVDIALGELENNIEQNIQPQIDDIQEEQTTQNNEISSLQTENTRLKATLPTTTGSGENITLQNTAELEFIQPPLPRGNSTQNGEPSPTNEAPITNVTGDVEVLVSNSDNTESQTFTFPLGTQRMFLGDYLADDGIHHVRKQIDLSTLSYTEYYSNRYRTSALANSIKKPATSFTVVDVLCNKYIKSYESATLTNGLIAIGTNGIMYIYDETGSPSGIIEYPLAEEEITPYTEPQQQAYDEIKQALSYEEQTNISGSSDESNPIFSVEAYQSTKLVLQEISNAVVALGGV